MLLQLLISVYTHVYNISIKNTQQRSAEEANISWSRQGQPSSVEVCERKLRICVRFGAEFTIGLLTYYGEYAINVNYRYNNSLLVISTPEILRTLDSGITFGDPKSVRLYRYYANITITFCGLIREKCDPLLNFTVYTVDIGNTNIPARNLI